MVMLRDRPSKWEPSSDSSRHQSLPDLLIALRGITVIAIAVVLTAGFGLRRAFASTSDSSGKLTVQRSTRAIPHRFLIRPSAPTVAPNQTQRFEVTDAEGNPVDVHWNISGIGCSDTTCGTIDEHGVYRTPPSITHPRVVTVEGVLASDSNYSVLTEVRIQEVGNIIASPAAPKVATAKPQMLAAPVIKGANVASRDELPPLPSAIAAAPVIAGPVIEGRSVASKNSAPPLPNAVAPAPLMSGQLGVSDSAVAPLPKVIAPAPEIRTQNVAAKTQPLPLPKAVGPAPALSIQIIASTKAEPPLAKVISPAPQIDRRSIPSGTLAPPLENVIAPAPEIPPPNIARDASLIPTPHAVAAAPTVQDQSFARDFAAPPPNVVVAAPVGQRTGGGSNSQPLPVTNAITGAPGIPAQKASTSIAMLAIPSVAATPAGERQISKGSVLPPMSSGGTADGTAVSAKPVVTYRDGQLTIDAENTTLATVLKLVAEKTGAVIDVPPGTGLEHIFEHTGPGQPNEVLTQLLNGSAFDFIIVNSPQRPQQPTEVLLSLRQAETPGPVPAAAVPVNNAALWTPPQEAPTPAVNVPYGLDSSLQPPKEELSPEALGELMKEKARELREKFQQPQPPPQ
jgi:hypothetical protein